MAKITKERKSLAVGLLIFVAVVIAAAVMGLIMLSPVTEYVEGQAEADEYRVSSKVPGRVVRFYVREGDTVRRGDTLVVLDAPDVLAKLEQARAAKDAAQAKQDEAMAGTRHEQVQAAYDMWQKAKAGLDIAVKSHRRVKELFEQGVLPEQKFDEAAAQLAAAQATEKAAHSQYQMAVNGARREDKAAAAAMVSRARGAVDEVESYVRETVLTAQADGEVSEIFPKAGELVGHRRTDNQRGHDGQDVGYFQYTRRHARPHRHEPQVQGTDTGARGAGSGTRYLLHERPRLVCRMESHKNHRRLRPQDIRGARPAGKAR